MFASCAYSVKLHAWPDEVLDEKSEYVPQNESKITHMSWCNDNTYMALLQEKEKPFIVSTKDPSDIHLVHTVNIPSVTTLAFKYGTKRNLALGTKNGEVVIYDTKARVITKFFPELDPPVTEVQFSYDDQFLGVLCDDSVVLFSDATQNADVNNEYKQPGMCSSIRFHPNAANHVGVGCTNGFVSLWDTKTATKLFNGQLHAKEITGLALTHTGNLLITAGRDHKICVTDLNSGECQFRIGLHLPVTCLDLRLDDKIIAAGLEDGSVYIYEMNYNVQPLASFKAHNSAVNRIAFPNCPRDSLSTESQITLAASEKEKAEENYKKAIEGKAGEGDVVTNEALEKVKKELMKMIKTQSEDIEHQLMQHCQRFQLFINSEFKIISDAIKDKWEVFNSGDLNQIFKTISGEDKSETKILSPK